MVAVLCHFQCVINFDAQISQGAEKCGYGTRSEYVSEFRSVLGDEGQTRIPRMR